MAFLIVLQYLRETEPQPAFRCPSSLYTVQVGVRPADQHLLLFPCSLSPSGLAVGRWAREGTRCPELAELSNGGLSVSVFGWVTLKIKEVLLMQSHSCTQVSHSGDRNALVLGYAPWFLDHTLLWAAKMGTWVSWRTPQSCLSWLWDWHSFESNNCLPTHNNPAGMVWPLTHHHKA